MNKTTTKRTSELVEGDIVVDWGMRCLIDQPIKVSSVHDVGRDGSLCRWTRALVLNRDEIEDGLVRSLMFDRRFPDRDDRLGAAPRWTIQGNDLATWSVEIPAGAELEAVAR